MPFHLFFCPQSSSKIIRPSFPETGLVMVGVFHRQPEGHALGARVLEAHHAVLDFASMNTRLIDPRSAPSDATVTLGGELDERDTRN